jgi:hypothetical protein
MVAIESVMLSCVIDAMERRDIATVDILGAFMQADMDDTINVSTCELKGEAHPICGVAQGTVRHGQGSATFLKAAHKMSKELGIPGEPL